MTELNLAGNSLGLDKKNYASADMAGVIAISDAIPTMGALVKFDVSKNNLGKEGTKALTEALNGNQIMAELNLAGNSMGKNGAMDIAKTIPTMGALVTVTVNKFALPIQDIKTKAELDLSGKELGVEDAIIIAALIPLNVSHMKRFNCCYSLILLL